MKNSLTNDSTYIVIVDDEKVGDPPKPPEPHRLLDVDVVIISQTRAGKQSHVDK